MEERQEAQEDHGIGEAPPQFDDRPDAGEFDLTVGGAVEVEEPEPVGCLVEGNEDQPVRRGSSQLDGMVALCDHVDALLEMHRPAWR